MAATISRKVLAEAVMPVDGAGLAARRVALVALGIAALVIAAKIRVPLWPVPVTMQTFAVLTIGAAYGARLGALTVIGYLALGALGFDVFTSSSAGTSGIAYMLGGTGGYLLGFVLAAALLGALARRGWDRSAAGMAGAFLLGEVAIYVPGLLWLGHLYAAEHGWAWVLGAGLWPFLVGDALKLALAALVLPLAWKAVGEARS